MQTWVIYAILSAVFAGITSILAKYGLENVNADLGLGIRTATIFFIITTINFVGSKYKDISLLTGKEVALLILSGMATTLSWLFYYRAMKEGLVSYVAAIDKSSIVVTLLLSFILFKDPVTPKILFGAGFIFIGMLILVWK
jgi:transporter family protein